MWIYVYEIFKLHWHFLIATWYIMVMFVLSTQSLHSFEAFLLPPYKFLIYSGILRSSQLWSWKSCQILCAIFYFASPFCLLLEIESVRSMSRGRGHCFGFLFDSSPCQGSWQSHHAWPPWSLTDLQPLKKILSPMFTTSHPSVTLFSAMSRCLVYISHSHINRTLFSFHLENCIFLAILAQDLWGWQG